MFQRHSDLLRQEVEVSANGMTYKGILVEVTDEDVKLKGKTGWIILPFQSVRRIAKANAAAKGFDPLRSVGSGFYDDQMVNDAKASTPVESAPRVTDLPVAPDLVNAPPLSEVPRDIATDDLEILPEAEIDDPFEAPAAPVSMSVGVEDWAAPPITPAPKPPPPPAAKPAPRPIPPAAAKPPAPPAARPAAPPAPRPAAPPPQAKPAAPPPRPAAPPQAKPAPAARPAAPPPARPAAPPATARPAPQPPRPPAAPARPSSTVGVVPQGEPDTSSSVEDLFRELQIPPGGKIPPE